MSYCLSHQEECVEYFDLVTIASMRGGIELLCDFYAFEQSLVEYFWQSITSISGNPYLMLLGGEYRSLDEYITKFVKDLQALSIKLVMFVDGSKGSSRSTTERKLETWKHRFTQDQDRATRQLDALHRRCQVEEIRDTKNVRPVLLEVQIVESLIACGVEIVQCVAGEADYVIARNLQRRPQAFAVLSNDSDFFVFADCRLITNELFDLSRDMRLGSAQRLPETPQKLSVGVISTTKVCSLLGVRIYL